MDLKEIKVLIDLMRKNDLSVFKMEKEGFKITLKKGNDFQPLAQPPLVALQPIPAAAINHDTVTNSAGSGAAATATAGNAPAASEPAAREILSPMVGTFYTAASPESPPYVEIGQEVTENTVVCIIEAMKVMNEIKSEVAGVVTELLVENGKPVQFGQPLFRLR